MGKRRIAVRDDNNSRQTSIRKPLQPPNIPFNWNGKVPPFPVRSFRCSGDLLRSPGSSRQGFLNNESNRSYAPVPLWLVSISSKSLPCIELRQVWTADKLSHSHAFTTAFVSQWSRLRFPGKVLARYCFD